MIFFISLKFLSEIGFECSCFVAAFTDHKIGYVDQLLVIALRIIDGTVKCICYMFPWNQFVAHWPSGIIQLAI